MKIRFLVIIVAILFLTACQTKQDYFTKEQLIYKSDSLTTLRFEELKKQADEDLELRMAIELKPKIDSILEGKNLTPVTFSRSPQEDSLAGKALQFPLRGKKLNPLILDTARRNAR